MIDRTITYNRETKDFDCFVDGRYIGSRPNYRAGDELCNEVAYDLCEQGLTDELPSFCATCGNDGDCPDCQPECPYCAHGAVPCPICDQPLLDDIAAVLDAALGNAPAKDIVPELRRVRQRIATTLV